MAKSRISKIAPADRQWCKLGKLYHVAERMPNDTGLPPGYYSADGHPQLGVVFTAQQITTDDLIVSDDSPTDQILQEIDQFHRLRDSFERRGFIHKRGILMHGPAGTGKTTTLCLLMRMFIEDLHGVVLHGRSNYLKQGLHLVREMYPERPLLVTFEDFDDLCDDNETYYLDLLDGGAQVDGIVFVATTNHIDRLSERVRCRPSRFDIVMEIGSPSESARRHYLLSKDPEIEQGALEEMVRGSDNFSFAHLKELIILSQCYGKTVEESLSRIRKLLPRK